jgi:O-antigen/teichoic acid export membrane protein
VTRNAALLLAARLVSAVTTVAVLVIVSRFRGAEALGLVAIGLAAGAILAALTEAGLTRMLIREAARDPAVGGQMFGTMLVTRLVTIPLALGLTWVVMIGLLGEGAAIVWLAAAGLVVQQLADLPRAVLLTYKRVGLLAAHSMLENILWLAVMTWVLASGGSLEAAMIAGVTTFGLSVIVGFILVWRSLRIRPSLPPLSTARRITVDAVPFTLLSLLTIIATRIDTLLIGALVPTGGLVAAGAYYASARLLAAFEYLPDAIGRLLLPELSRAHGQDLGMLRRTTLTATRFLILTGTPIPFGLVVFGPWLLVTIFGDHIGDHAWLLIALGALVPLRFLYLLFGTLLTSVGSHWRRAAAVGVAVALVVAINVALLPRIGVAGAVIGAAVGTIAVLALFTRGVQHAVGPLPFVRPVTQALIGSVAAMAVGLGVRVWLADATGRSPFPGIAEPVAGLAFALTYVIVAGVLMRSWARDVDSQLASKDIVLKSSTDTNAAAGARAQESGAGPPAVGG